MVLGHLGAETQMLCPKKNKDCKDMLEHTPTFLYLTTQFFLGQIKIS